MAVLSWASKIRPCRAATATNVSDWTPANLHRRWVQRSAKRFIRHQSNLHLYSSGPPGTRNLINTDLYQPANMFNHKRPRASRRPSVAARARPGGASVVSLFFRRRPHPLQPQGGRGCPAPPEHRGPHRTQSTAVNRPRACNALHQQRSAHCARSRHGRTAAALVRPSHSNRCGAGSQRTALRPARPRRDDGLRKRTRSRRG